MTYHLHSTNIHTALLSIKNTDVPITKYQVSRYSVRFVPQRLTPLYHMNTILSNSACFLGSWHLNPGTPQSILTNSHYPLGRACTMIKIQKQGIRKINSNYQINIYTSNRKIIYDVILYRNIKNTLITQINEL